MSGKKRVLFVCSANTCRSPAAEAILREYGSDRYDVGSAGLFAREGDTMMDRVASALADLFGHPVASGDYLSKRLNGEMMIFYDEIVAVSEGYASMIRAVFPECAEKVTAFEEGISDFSTLSDDALAAAVVRLRGQIAARFGV